VAEGPSISMRSVISRRVLKGFCSTSLFAGLTLNLPPVVVPPAPAVVLSVAFKLLALSLAVVFCCLASPTYLALLSGLLVASAAGFLAPPSLA
jgi:hypothetical protein